jgi:hypothetical protein
MLLTFSAIALVAAVLRAQDQAVEIKPIVVTGTFELRREAPAVDAFTKHLERQIETKRAEHEAIGQSPIWHARFWSFLPRLESSSDFRQFLTPHYLTPGYREAARSIEYFRVHSLFDAQPTTKD